MNISEAPLDRLSETGFSADYVYRRRSGPGRRSGNQDRDWPGIDIDVPRRAPGRRRERSRGDGRGPARGGARVLLSRAYLEMKPENLRGAGQALEEFGAGVRGP